MPVYEEKEKVDGQKRYYIRTYVEDEFGTKKQITRHNKVWVGREGKKQAEYEEVKLKNESAPIIKKIKKYISLKEAMELYLASIQSKIDEDTLKGKKTMLRHFCDTDKTNQVTTYPDRPINSFNKEIYSKWQKQMREKIIKKDKHFSISYLNDIHNTICSMLNYLINENYCQFNFANQAGRFGTTKEIKMEKVHKPFKTINFDEYKRLMRVSNNNLKYNTYFNLSFTRGPRPGEIRAFRICDYDEEKKQLMVNHTMSKDNKLKEPKTPSSKAPIDLDDEVNDKIKKLICELRKNERCNDNWFIFGGEGPISSNALDHAKNKYFKLGNINKHIRLHDFRHSCATWLFSINIPITVISKILRHANIQETAKTYTHLLNEDYVNCLKIIENHLKQDQKQDQN